MNFDDDDPPDDDDTPSVNPKHGPAAYGRELLRHDRLRDAARMLRQRLPPEEIYAKLCKKYEISRRTAREDIERVLSYARAKTAEESIEQVRLALVEWDEQKEIARADGAHAAAGAAIKQKHLILGHYLPKRVEVSGSIGVGVQAQIAVAVEARFSNGDRVLDENDLAVLATISAKFERARAEGVLPDAGQLALAEVVEAVADDEDDPEEEHDNMPRDSRRRRPH